MSKQLNFLTVLGIIGTVSVFGQDTLNYTGGMETYTVPDGVTKIQLEVWGAQAEAVTVDDFDGSLGGLGGYAKGELDVTPGDVINVYVGGQGMNGAGGWNGGGTGGSATAGDGGTTGFGGSGGGASDVRIDGVALSDRVIVAGGGGGGGRDYVNGSCIPCGTGGNGGHGGGLSGLDGDDPSDDIYGIYFNPGAGASGGTNLVGGSGGIGAEGMPGMAGSPGIGGVGINGSEGTASGGGGGGYFGGGSGAGPSTGSGAAGGGGAGGSSYIDGVIDGSTSVGLREGDGMVIITPACDAPIALTATVSDEFFGSDGAIDLDVSGGIGEYTFDWDTDGSGDFDDMEDLAGLVAGTYVVTIASGGTCDTLTESFVVNSQVSIEDETLELEMRVYPNPTQSNVTLTVNEAFEYTIHSLSGQIILTGNGTGTIEIELGALENGIYMLTVKTAEQNKTVRLIKH